MFFYSPNMILFTEFLFRRLNLFIILSDIAIDNKEAYYRKFKNGFDFGRQCLYFFFICFNNDLGLFQGKIPGGGGGSELCQ